MLYGQLEEEYGLAKRAMAVYDRATKEVEAKDRMEASLASVLAPASTLLTDDRSFTQMFTYYIARATASFGLAATRPIYERAIESLPDSQTAEMCLRFAALERKLGEIDRARAIYAHASQFCDPRVRAAPPCAFPTRSSRILTHPAMRADQCRVLGAVERLRDRDWIRGHLPRGEHPSLVP